MNISADVRSPVNQRILGAGSASLSTRRIGSGSFGVGNLLSHGARVGKNIRFSGDTSRSGIQGAHSGMMTKRLSEGIAGSSCVVNFVSRLIPIRCCPCSYGSPGALAAAEATGCLVTKRCWFPVPSEAGG